MPKLIAKRRIVPDAGKHMCVLLRVEEVENKFYDPKKDSADKAKRLEWTFQYVEKPEMEIRVWSSTNLSIYRGTKSNALRLAESLLDKEMTKAEMDKGAETEKLIGKKCFLEVKHMKQDDGTIFAKVRDFESETGIPF
jgi:hypothetical protein